MAPDSIKDAVRFVFEKDAVEKIITHSLLTPSVLEYKNNKINLPVLYFFA